MKNIYLLFIFIYVSVSAQQSYYNDVDLSLSGIALKNELANKIISTHTNFLSNAEIKQVLKIIDLDPGQNSNVLLLYGFSNGICPADSSTDEDHRRRNKDSFDNGLNDPCLWNREHTYPKALGTPNLGTSGPGADAHHLRAADKKRNASRGNKLFANGSGNSGVVNSNWYPGDEWKGDVARMMMYMYLRYGSQCLPSNVGVGNAVANDPNMIDLFLDWNAEDPVSAVEENRNDYLELTSNTYGQGNRNPFIDDPYLATRIWGGQNAQDIWGLYLDIPSFSLEQEIEIFPNPVQNSLNIKANNVVIKSVSLFSILGKKVKTVLNKTSINTEKLHVGVYFVEIKTNKGSITKKIVKM